MGNGPCPWPGGSKQGAIGFATQKALLEAVAPWMPAGTPVRLMGDRFYGTADLIGWGQERDCGYRLRLKGKLVGFKPAPATAGGTRKTTTPARARGKRFYLEGGYPTRQKARTPH